MCLSQLFKKMRLVIYLKMKWVSYLKIRQVSYPKMRWISYLKWVGSEFILSWIRLVYELSQILLRADSVIIYVLDTILFWVHSVLKKWATSVCNFCAGSVFPSEVVQFVYLAGSVSHSELTQCDFSRWSRHFWVSWVSWAGSVSRWGKNIFWLIILPRWRNFRYWAWYSGSIWDF